ncbi:MAG: purine-nucleoside phosphorylase [Candidatus Eiseniibacteriota bacterium]|nr:MAG: purine-nucleoside phosphorylase [Candidatus Eisenbacteria bacterium]
MASDLKNRIDEAASFIRSKSDVSPSIGIILGTGLGQLAKHLQAASTIAYSDIPNFPVSTVEYHAGELMVGTLAGKPVVTMCGRVHYYEGYTMQEVTFPVRVMKALGAHVLIVSSAVGAMNPDFDLGDLVIVRDHINLMGDNPLMGPNDAELGPRFPDMSRPYDNELIRLAEDAARREKVTTHRGILVAVAGPNLETAAEYRFLRSVGADVVGMSVVPENLVAVHGSMRVLGLSVVTDKCIPETLEPADIERILRVAQEAEPRLARIVMDVVSHI